MSSTEPIAVALTWICLILSQQPELRRALRSEIGQISLAAAAPPAHRLARLTLMESVINESLRLFPPNALMARVTTKPADLNGVALPERCEIVLCPFIAHRDARRFPNPNQFLPSRWSKLKPSPFEYFPFGAGGHSCVGRHHATYLIKAALSIILLRYDLILAADQEIDWRIHIQFMPRSNPMMLVCEPEVTNLRAGKLFGPIGDLIDFPG